MLTVLTSSAIWFFAISFEIPGADLFSRIAFACGPIAAYTLIPRRDRDADAAGQVKIGDWIAEIFGLILAGSALSLAVIFFLFAICAPISYFSTGHFSLNVIKDSEHRPLWLLNSLIFISAHFIPHIFFLIKNKLRILKAR